MQGQKWSTYWTRSQQCEIFGRVIGLGNVAMLSRRAWQSGQARNSASQKGQRVVGGKNDRLSRSQATRGVARELAVFQSWGFNLGLSWRRAPSRAPHSSSQQPRMPFCTSPEHTHGVFHSHTLIIMSRDSRPARINRDGGAIRDLPYVRGRIS